MRRIGQLLHAQRASQRSGLRALAFALLCLGATHAAAVDPAPKDENSVKAAFVLNLLRFIEWPADTLGEGPIVVGIAGVGSFEQSLAEVFEGKQIDGHSVELRVVEEAAQIRGCRLLYLGELDPNRLGAYLSAAAESPILTVSDAPGFNERGGHVRLFRAGTRLRLSIYRTRLESVGLSAHARLLQIGEIYETGR